jgi:hypothetical protein
VSGAWKSRRLSNVLTCGFLGRFSTAATSGNPHTSSLQFALEADFDAVRIIIPNSVTSDVTGVKATISAGTQAGANGSATAIDPTASSGGVWTPVTFAGSSTVTLPAGTSVDAVSWTASDWMRCSSLPRADGGTQPLLWVRLLIPGANANRPAWYFGGITDWETEATVAGRIRRFRSQANTDGVTAGSEGNFTTSSISNFNCTPCYVQYLSRKTGVTVMIPGDSIMEGTGAVSQRGWQFTGRDAVSTPNAPVELCTVAIAGSNSTTWRTRLAALINTVNPDYVTVPAYEVNDQATPMAGTGQSISRSNAQQAVKLASDNGAVPISITGCPSNEAAKALGAGDSLRRSINADVRALPSGRAWMDFDALLAGSAVASGQVEFIPAYTTDGLHPNTVGHGVLGASAFAPALRNILAANGMST